MIFPVPVRMERYESTRNKQCEGENHEKQWLRGDERNSQRHDNTILSVLPAREEMTKGNNAPLSRT